MNIEVCPVKKYKINMLEILKKLVLNLSDMPMEMILDNGDAVCKFFMPKPTLWNYIKKRVKHQADYEIHPQDLWEAEANDWGEDNSLVDNFIYGVMEEINALLNCDSFFDRDICLRNLNQKHYSTLVKQAKEWKDRINGNDE